MLNQRGTNVSQLDMDEIPTAKTCPECKGNGFVVIERGNIHRGKTCEWCKGEGRIPVSGMIPAVLDPKRAQ